MPISFHLTGHSPLCFPTPGDSSDPRPPEVDSSPLPDMFDSGSTHLLLQMFMSELDSSTGGEGVPVPSPSPCHSNPPSHLSTPVECTDPSGLDDPFLMEFMDVNELLHGTNLLDSFPSSPDFSVTPPPVANTELFLTFSDHTSPFSSSSDSEVTFDFSEDALGLNSPVEEQPSPMLSQQLVTVKHDHSYASTPTDSEPTTSHKQSLHKTSGRVKKPKPIVKDQKYLVRRQKNNIASQSSRAKRRAKISSMFGRVGELEAMNTELRAQVEQLTAETERLKKMLIDRLAK